MINIAISYKEILYGTQDWGRVLKKDKLGRDFELSGGDVVWPLDSRDDHWFGQARTGLVLLCRQQATLHSADDMQVMNKWCLGVQWKSRCQREQKAFSTCSLKKGWLLCGWLSRMQVPAFSLPMKGLSELSRLSTERYCPNKAASSKDHILGWWLLGSSLLDVFKRLSWIMLEIIESSTSWSIPTPPSL